MAYARLGMAHGGLGASVAAGVSVPSYTPKSTACGRVAASGQGSPEDIQACGQSIIQAGSVAEAGHQVTQVVREIAVDQAALLGGTVCAATGAGAIVSPICAVAAGWLANEIAGPLTKIINQQWDYLSCIADCDCMTASNRAVEARGRQIYDAFAPLCSDASCRGWIRKRYVDNLPSGTTTIKVAGVSAKKCAFKRLPTNPAKWRMVPDHMLPVLTGGGVQMPPASLFDRSAQRSATFVARTTANLAGRYLAQCADEQGRQEISMAAAAAATQFAKVYLDAGVPLPNAPVYPVPSDPKAYASGITSAASKYEARARAIVSTSLARATAASKLAGQQALQAQLQGKVQASGLLGQSALDAWKREQTRTARTTRNRMLLGAGLGLCALAGAAYVAGNRSARDLHRCFTVRWTGRGHRRARCHSSRNVSGQPHPPA